MVRFDLGPLLSNSNSTSIFIAPNLYQGQTRTAIFKSAYKSFIIGPRGLQCETNL